MDFQSVPVGIQQIGESPSLLSSSSHDARRQTGQGMFRRATCWLSISGPVGGDQERQPRSPRVRWAPRAHLTWGDIPASRHKGNMSGSGCQREMVQSMQHLLFFPLSRPMVSTIIRLRKAAQSATDADDPVKPLCPCLSGMRK